MRQALEILRQVQSDERAYIDKTIIFHYSYTPRSLHVHRVGDPTPTFSKLEVLMDNTSTTETEQKNVGSVAAACFAGGVAGMTVLFALGLSWLALIGFPIGALVAYVVNDIPDFVAGCKKAVREAMPLAVKYGQEGIFWTAYILYDVIALMLTIHRRPFVVMGVIAPFVLYYSGVFQWILAHENGLDAAGIIYLSKFLSVVSLIIFPVLHLLAEAVYDGRLATIDRRVANWVDFIPEGDSILVYDTKVSWWIALAVAGLVLAVPLVAVLYNAHSVCCGVWYLLTQTPSLLRLIARYTYTTERMVCLTHTPLGMVITTTVLISIYGASFTDMSRFLALAWIFGGGLASMTIGLIGYKYVMPRIQALSENTLANKATSE